MTTWKEKYLADLQTFHTARKAAIDKAMDFFAKTGMTNQFLVDIEYASRMFEINTARYKAHAALANLPAEQQDVLYRLMIDTGLKDEIGRPCTGADIVIAELRRALIASKRG